MDFTIKFASGFKKLRTQIKSLTRFKALIPLIQTLQNFYLIFRFIRDYRKTSNYLQSEWGSEYTNYIPLKSCHEIIFPHKKNSFSYNPTLCMDKGKLRFFTRITNVSNKPEVNIFGQLKKRGAKSETFNGIAEFELDDCHQVINYVEIVELAGVPNLEDPKAFVLESQVVLFCNLIVKEPIGVDRTFISKNAIFTLDSKSVNVLESPYFKNIEKNWIPIDVVDETLRLFYSCNPLTILKVNLTDGATSVEIIDRNLQTDFHGGSQLIRINEDLLVRVVRRKMQMKNLGMIAVSYLMFHNNDLTVNKISKPFLFRKFGFEICNGLTLIDDCLVFTWGEDDIRNFIGRIQVNELINWAFN